MRYALTFCIALAFAAGAQARPSGGHGSGHTTHTGTTAHNAKAATGTGAKAEHEYVHAYTKKDGTHVEAHDRSTRDETKDNNWSTKGNVNPETGKPGTK